MDAADYHNTLDALEVAMMGHPAREIPVRHAFLPGGLYIRTIVVPPDTLFSGEEHTTRHPWIMHRGKMVVQTLEGPVLLAGYNTGITEPGTRRVAYTLEETEFSTVHITDLTDPEEIRRAITVKRTHRDGLVQPPITGALP